MGVMNKLAQLKTARFALVGIGNTLLDFLLFNALLFLFSATGNAQRTALNTLSFLSVAVVSYLVNRRFVFRSSVVGHRRLIGFIAVNVISLIIGQQIVLWLYLEHGTSISDIFVDITNLDFDFIHSNAAKAAGTAISMVVNFVLYDRLVFSDQASKKPKQPA